MRTVTREAPKPPPKIMKSNSRFIHPALLKVNEVKSNTMKPIMEETRPPTNALFRGMEDFQVRKSEMAREKKM